MPFDEIPRAQGPFRSGQDNQEPIYDNSRVKMGADVGDAGTLTLEDIEGGGKPGYGKKPKYGRLSDRLQRHIDNALAVAGDHPAWVSAFLSEM